MSEVVEEKIKDVHLAEELSKRYLSYAMSTIVARSLPDVRDGLKPVHRRLLYAMRQLHLDPKSGFKKCARVVGDVIGKYHPHGDSAVYMAMVRLAQDFSVRYPLVDGQGNFGNIDGDGPAAMRYTEARLTEFAMALMEGLNDDAVDFRDTYDGEESEPVVMPGAVPNLLCNGSAGIAVGMATNIPPHNLSEVCDALLLLIEKPDVEIEPLVRKVKGPDFPTGGIIIDSFATILANYTQGRGNFRIRAKWEKEDLGQGQYQIVVTEIPYLVNKAELIKNIADLVEEKRLDGISNINDESDRAGMRIVIDIKKDANSSVVLNKLYKLTALQSSFSVNNIALVNGRPQVLNLKQLIEAFIDHRHEVVVRRTQFELREAEKKAHILEGLIIACDHIDEVIQIIRSSKSPDEARERLIERFGLTDAQSRAIVDMRLRQLTGLEQDKLREEYKKLVLDEIERVKEARKGEEV